MTIVSELGELQHRLAAAMEQRGAWPRRSAWIRQTIEALPRHDFAPERLWSWDGNRYVPVDRGRDPERWAGEVYAGPDTAAVTQITAGLATSSLSCQAVVVDMLDSLLLEPGHRVLELGTGCGWNAALLDWRAGPHRTISVETDPRLAGAARRALERAGASVSVQAADGNSGWPAGAFYDRVIATYAVERIPWAWLAQTRPGGRIVAPWGRLGHVALTVAEDGQSATGWVQGLAQFMPARGTEVAEPGFLQVRGSGDSDDERPFLRDLAPLHGDAHLRFALRVALPDVRITVAADEDGLNSWIHDGASSWAVLSALGDGKTIADQGGPRRLADELETAWDAWHDAGRPDLYDYGMTVQNGGATQYMWAHDPATGPRWPLT
ncbi:protein-L-isoaspartate O-methyltransferase [Streptomyces sp. RK9]|uniref:protein-L-isoaspartate O-methyltransferase n=1 Tax=Streptomyces sp. RK9 TaxID=3239284 RepID=UPI00386AD5A1